MPAIAHKPSLLHHRIFPGTWVQHGNLEIFQVRSMNPSARELRLVADHPGVAERLVTFTELDEQYRQVSS